MKRFATIALSALVIALLIGVYIGQTPQDETDGQRASGIEPAAGQQQPAPDAVEESIKRIEETMQEMEKQNNAQEQNQDQDKPGDQSRAETPGIENLNAPTEPTGDGVTEIIHAESMESDENTNTGETAADTTKSQQDATTADRVQGIEPAAGDGEDAKETVKDPAEQDHPGTTGDETDTEQGTQDQQ